MFFFILKSYLYLLSPSFGSFSIGLSKYLLGFSNQIGLNFLVSAYLPGNAVPAFPILFRPWVSPLQGLGRHMTTLQKWVRLLILLVYFIFLKTKLRLWVFLGFFTQAFFSSFCWENIAKSSLFLTKVSSQDFVY